MMMERSGEGAVERDQDEREQHEKHRHLREEGALLDRAADDPFRGMSDGEILARLEF